MKKLRHTHARRRMKKGLLLGVVFAMITGLASFRLWSTSRMSADRVAVMTPARSLPSNVDGILPLSQITTIASKASGQPLARLSLLSNKDGLVYKATYTDGSNAFFNAISGAIAPAVQTSETPVSNSITPLPDSAKATLSLEEARMLAEAQKSGATIKSLALENRPTGLVISAEFADASRVDIDAGSGKIITDTQPGNPGTAASPGTRDTGQEFKKTDAAKGTDASPVPDSPSPRSSSDTPQNTSASATGDGTSSMKVQGILTESNGSFAVVDNGTAYLLQTKRQDLRRYVGSRVTVVGSLLPGGIIEANSLEVK